MCKNKLIRILGFLLIAFLLPLICVLLMKIESISNIEWLVFILYGIEAASPFISAILMVLILDSKEGLIKFLKERYINNINIKAIILAVVVPVIIALIAKFIGFLFDDETNFINMLSSKKIIIICWALIAEELGWRGYLSYELDDILPKPIVPLVIGLIWSLWHYHFFMSGSLSVPIYLFVIGCICESYGYYVVTKMSNYNIIPASIWHFISNLMINLFMFDPSNHQSNSSFYFVYTLSTIICIFLFIVVCPTGRFRKKEEIV